MLKPQDVMIVLKIVAMHQREWKYNEAALELHMSPSEVHAGVKRLKKCCLLNEMTMGFGTVETKLHLPDIENIKEFLQHGLRYVFPTVTTEPVSGLPTSYGVVHLFEGYHSENSYIPVWEHNVGDYMGVGVKPLYKSAPKACMDDFQFYELMSLAEALRSSDDKLHGYAWQKMNIMLGA
ncbi:MAG: hypothetical protein C0603_06965 [Denitrovibrio sp.]|nr:MAG: hypothetical protein C0603_06965 [Denitrovibrio sp.]